LTRNAFTFAVAMVSAGSVFHSGTNSTFGKSFDSSSEIGQDALVVAGEHHAGRLHAFHEIAVGAVDEARRVEILAERISAPAWSLPGDPSASRPNR